MPAPRPILIRNIIVSLTASIALIVIVSALIFLGNNIGLEQNTLIFDTISGLLIALIAFFLLVFCGSFVEYYGREPGIFTIITSYLIPLVLAYYSGLFRDNTRTAITILLFVIVLLYVLVAKPSSEK